MLLSTLILTLFTPLLPAASAFSFTTSTNDPTQCQNVNITWEGGTPPFRMLVMPAFDYPANISIPDSAWSGGRGSYQWTVNYPTGTDFVLLMSDATGLGMGGVSRLFTVGAESTGSSCTLRSEDTDFFFYLNQTSVNQCDPVEVYWDNTANPPVTILGVIPQGQPFQFESAGTSTSSVWNTNIAAGTQFILAAFAPGRTGIGGSSALLTVGAGPSTCLDDSSPSSTPVGSPTASETGTKTGGGGGVKTVTSITTAVPKGAAGLSTGAIAGIAIAAVVVVLVAQGLLFWFCCRRQLAALLSHRKQMREREVKPGDVDLVDDPENESADRPTSLHIVRTRETGNRLSLSGIPGARTRSSIGDTYEESSISPYWDPQPAGTGSSGYLPVQRGPFDSPPEDDFAPLAPPQAGHLRNDSMSSSNSRQLMLNLDTSPSILSLPQFSPTTNSNPSASATSATGYPSVPGTAYSPRRGSGGLGASGSAGGSGQTKAQMAASLSAQNPDNGSTAFGGHQPSAHAPAGGFRFHEDAGRVDEPPTMDDCVAEVEELPPMYRPEWETESQRGRGGRRSGVEEGAEGAEEGVFGRGSAYGSAAGRRGSGAER